MTVFSKGGKRPTPGSAYPLTSIRSRNEHDTAQGCPARYARLYEPLPEAGRDALWARLREEHGPVAPVEIEPGVHVWLLLGYQENLTVLQQPHLFSRDTRRWREVSEGRTDLARPSFSWRPNALYADGAEHARLRAPMVDALERVDTAGLERTVRGIAGQLVDAFVAGGRADLVSGYALPLPALVINSLYGLPDQYGHMLGGLTSIVFDQEAKRGEEGVARMYQYFTGLVARKRRHPGRDLVSWMLQHPAGLTDDEVAHQAALINNAGHMPTAHLIGNTMWTLLTDPRVRAAHTDARLPVQTLLDHVMWSNTPFQTLLGRVALQDVQLGGAHIRAGDALLLGFAPAHRDPAVQDRGPGNGAGDGSGGGPGHGTADDAGGNAGNDTGVAGGSRSHLMFGAGPHTCPARDLARTIAATGVSVLHERLSGLRLAVAPEELRWAQSPFVRGLRALPVQFEPAAPRGPRSAPGSGADAGRGADAGSAPGSGADAGRGADAGSAPGSGAGWTPGASAGTGRASAPGAGTGRTSGTDRGPGTGKAPGHDRGPRTETGAGGQHGHDPAPGRHASAPGRHTRRRVRARAKEEARAQTGPEGSEDLLSRLLGWWRGSRDRDR